MKLNELFPSTYLKKDDIPRPMVVTIDCVVIEMVGADEDKEQKPIINFRNCEKAMVLNKTNATELASMFGDDTDKWAGKTIELYADHSIMFAGKRVGGIRIRAAKDAVVDDTPF
jgi:hypothetical protein